MQTHMTIKELPASERPYEKCMQYGARILSDAELLAVIIRTGSRGEQSVELSQRILKLTGQEGIGGLSRLSVEELTSVRGVGPVKAIQIQCIGELSRRIARAEGERQVSLNSPGSIAAYYMEDLRHEGQEQVMLVMFDTKNHLIGDKMISLGTVNASIVSPRDIFIEALRKQAVYIVLIHNHPSGDATPSREDRLITRRVKEIGDMIGIQLIDHIIIGGRNYISLSEQGML